MKSKVFVGTLLAAVILAAGVAQAGPSVIKGKLHKDGVRYFNVTADSTAILWLELFLKESRTDADIVIFDVTDGDDSRDVEDAIAVFNSTVGGYEVAAISVVAGTTIVICVVNESGPASRFDLISWSKSGTDIVTGDVRMAGPSISVNDGGTFNLYGPVSPEMAGIQASLQRISAAKRR